MGTAPLTNDHQELFPFENLKTSPISRSSQFEDQPSQEEHKTKSQNKPSIPSVVERKPLLTPDIKNSKTLQKQASLQNNITETHDPSNKKKAMPSKNDEKKETVGKRTERKKHNAEWANENEFLKKESKNMKVKNSVHRESATPHNKQERQNMDSEVKILQPLHQHEFSRLRKEKTSRTISHELVGKERALSPRKKPVEKQTVSDGAKRWDPIPLLSVLPPIETNDREEVNQVKRSSVQMDSVLSHNAKQTVILAAVGPVSSFDKNTTPISNNSPNASNQSKQRADEDIRVKNTNKIRDVASESKQTSLSNRTKKRIPDRNDSSQSRNESKQWVQLSSQ